MCSILLTVILPFLTTLIAKELSQLFDNLAFIMWHSLFGHLIILSASNVSIRGWGVLGLPQSL